MSRGKRYDDTPKLNMKKVIATIVAIIVLIMFVLSLKNLLTPKEKTNDVSSLLTYIAVYENDKWGVIDNKGNVIIKPSYDEMIIIPNKNKDVFVCTYDVNYDNETYKTKVLNAEGKEILTDYPNVEVLENVENSKIWYEKDILKIEKNGKYGLIDFSGKEVLAPEYDNISVLSGIEKSLVLEKDGKKGIFSTSSREIIVPVQYSEVSSLTKNYENGYVVKNEEGKYGVISIDKQIVVDVKYDEVKNIYGNNTYVVRNDKTMEVIDTTGKVLLDKGFDSIEDINLSNLTIIKDSKYGVISIDGTSIIPAEYEDLKYISNNYFIAKKDGKYGVISNTNEAKIDFVYENMSYINEAGFIEAENENYTTDIYTSNLEKKLENVIISDLNIENGYLRVRKGNEYEYYNFKFEQKDSTEVLATSTLFLFKDNNKYGYKNKNGDIIVDAIYDDAKEQNEFGYCAVKKDGLWGSLKSDGTIVVNPSVNLDDYLYIDFIDSWYRYNDLSVDVYTK